MVERKAVELFGLKPIIPYDKIVGVRQRSVAEFEEADHWVRLDKYVADKYKNNKEAEKAAIRAVTWKEVNDSYEFTLVHNLRQFRNKPTAGLFLAISKALAQLEADSKNPLAIEYNTALPFLGKTLGYKDEYAEIKRLYKSFEQHYPMLPLIRDWHDTRAQSAISHYIGLVDGIQLNRKRGKKKKKAALRELQEV